MEKDFELNYQSSTNEANNLLICLHGNSTDSNYFSALLNGIDGWKVVAPDYIGHGNSPQLEPSDYNFEVFVQCLVDFISQFSYNKLVIIGHSLGGNLAMELMKVMKVDGVLLLVAPPVSYTINMAPYLKLPDFELTDDDEKNNVLVENYVSELSPDPTTVAYLKKTFLNTDPVFRDHLLEEFGAMKFSDQLEILKQNKSTFTGCLLAQNDNLANNEYLNQLKNEGVFDFFEEISDSGHYSLLEKAKENLESIKGFLEKLS